MYSSTTFSGLRPLPRSTGGASTRLGSSTRIWAISPNRRSRLSTTSPRYIIHTIYLLRLLTLLSRLSCPNLLIGETPRPSLASEFFYSAYASACNLTTFSKSWFLDNPELNWTAPQTLIDWMAKARADGKPIVYIGFGSITVPDPKLVTERLIRGVQKSKCPRYP